MSSRFSIPPASPQLPCPESSQETSESSLLATIWTYVKTVTGKITALFGGQQGGMTEQEKAQEMLTWCEIHELSQCLQEVVQNMRPEQRAAIEPAIDRFNAFIEAADPDSPSLQKDCIEQLGYLIRDVNRMFISCN